MKYLLYTVLGLLALAGCNESSQSKIGGTAFQVKGDFNSCSGDSVYVFELNGFDLRSIASAPLQKAGDKTSFTLSGEVPQQGYYWIGLNKQNAKILILGGEKGVTLSGDCNNLTKAGKVSGSPFNDQLEQLNITFRELQQKIQSRSQRMQQGGTPELSAEIDDLNARQVAIVDSLKMANPLMAKIFSLSLLDPFDPAAHPEYHSAVEYFATQSFNQADLSDPGYNHLPVLSDNLTGYLQTVFGSGMAQTQAEAYLDNVMAKIPKGSLAWKNALSRVIYVLSNQQSPSTAKYANLYIQQFPNDPVSTQLQQMVAQLEAKARAEQGFSQGAEAPEISLPNPDGKVIKLSDLRGKVVMIDFWASWCGPCRRENPNVVRVYQKYKSQGFEILGVSLDKDRNRWLQAIQDDNLGWLHVSDLKFWQSIAAQTYQVSSIPQTFLIDRDGKILAKGLRGPALEARLAELFGS